MKPLTLALVASALLLSTVGTTQAFAQQYVRGYTRSDGTYVRGYYRSQPDGNVWNNYSTQGNYNPYTGQAGTVNPYSNGNTYGSTMYGFHPTTFGNTYSNSGY